MNEPVSPGRGAARRGASASSVRAHFPVVGLLCAAHFAVAQVVPAQKPMADPERTTVLQPFEVVADKSDTYEALNFSSLSGTNRPLEKLPVTAEIFNATMLADLGTSDIVNLLNNFVTGVGPGEGAPGTPSASGTEEGDRFGMSSFRVRGLNAGPIRRNGFLTVGNMSEGFATDRVEVIRGPQSLLYGNNPAGGIINIMTKKASFGSTYYRPQVQVDSQGSVRYQFDANVAGKPRGHRAAVRFSLLDEDANFWREVLNRKSKGLFAEVALELLPASRTMLRVEGEDRTNITVESRGRALVAGIPTIIPDNTPLPVLLSRHDPALGRIANGMISWENVDSLAGTSNVTRRREQFYTATLSSELTPWLQAQVIGQKQFAALQRLSTGAFTNLRAPLTGGNPLNAWAVGYSPGGNQIYQTNDGLRALLTANFAVTRHTRNSLVVGAETVRTPAYGQNFNANFYEVDASGNFIVNATQLNTANAGRNPIPIQWVDISTHLPGYVALKNKRYIVNGRSYVWDEQKHANPAFIGPGNPFGFNAGPAGAVKSHSDGQAVFGGLFTTWLDGRLETMAGARSDHLRNQNLSPGQEISGKGTSGNLGFVWNATKFFSVYGGASSNFSPGSFNFAQRYDGGNLPNGRGEGYESGLKLNALEGRLSGSLTYYSTKSINESEPISTGARSATDPSGINGTYYGTLASPSINYDRKTHGVEMALTARPTRSWRLQLGYSLNEGREGSAISLPFLYNDEFRTNAQGQVLLSDGTPLRVPVSPTTPIAADGKTYAATVATQIMTVGILRSGDASGNYRAQIASDTGRIQNAAALGLAIPGVGTARPGLPISQHQLGFVPATSGFEARRGGDRTNGYPRQSFTATSMYQFTEGRLKGLGLGVNGSFTYDTLLYYYVDASSGNARRPYFGANRTLLNLIASYDWRLSRRVSWKTQFNLSNALDRRDLLVLPNATTGAPDNAALRTDPRKLVWTNTLSF